VLHEEFEEIGEQLLVFSRNLVGQAGEADGAILQRRDELIAKMLELLPPTETGVDNE